MPFTFAHPAAVLPLHRRWPRPFVLSALVIGSMAPDFAYLPVFLSSRPESHSLAGSFVFCVPAGFVVYLLFHLLLKAPLTALLPPALEARARASLARAPRLPDRPLLVVLASLWLGSASHLLWDSFTHSGSPMTRALPFLSIALFRIDGYRVEVCRVLQHLSTLLGLWILARAVRRAAAAAPAPSSAPRTPLTAGARVAVASVLVLAPVIVGFAWRREDWIEARGPVDVQTALFFTAITALNAFGWALVLYAAGWHSLRAVLRRG